MRKKYVWTAEIEPAEEGKINVWLGEKDAKCAKYENVTPEEIGNILAEDIKVILKLLPRYGKHTIMTR